MATTTNYSWTTPDNTAYVKDGASAIRTLGTSVDTTLFTALGGAYPGLRLIKKQTIGTGVSSVTVTNAFSATYDNYKIVVSGGVSSAENYGYLKLGASTTGYYFGAAGASFAGGAFAGLNANNAAAWNYTWGHLPNQLELNIDLQNPFLAKYTNIQSNYSSSAYGFAGAGYHGVATSYTDFTIGSISTPTLTGGTIYVYGYGAS